MRVLLPLVFLMVSLLLVAGVMLLWARVSGPLSARRPARVAPSRGERVWNAATRWVAKREARRQARVPWTHYSEADPHTGDYLIGIKQVYRDTVMRRVELQRVPAEDQDARWAWELTASTRAAECNKDRDSETH